MTETQTDGAVGTVMLKLTDVNTYYGRIRALQGLDLEVAQGEIVTLIGANGAGKTTTLKTISAFSTRAKAR
jgi:branched-chain amino acid transport system ATP-binding protein